MTLPPYADLLGLTIDPDDETTLMMPEVVRLLVFHA